MGKFAYDIRGEYPNVVNEELAYRAGRAIAIFLKAKNVTVGRDCRTSSLALKKSLIYGLCDQGCRVTDIGYCNTPMAYFASKKQHALMVTASHNPPQYNGIKITRKGVEPIGEHNGLGAIEKLLDKCHYPDPKRKGTVRPGHILKEYARRVRSIVRGKYKPIRALIDCGNGMAGYVVPELLKGLPVRYKLLYGELDGTFPNHTPNPAIPENTKDLEREMRKGKFDIGIAYDGDCDRVYFIDEKGNRIRPEIIQILFAKELLKKGDSVFYTVNCSKIVQEAAKELGLKAHPSPIGHTEIPRTMKKHKAALAAEITGHFYFKKFNYADSGDIGALLMLSILSKSGKKLSELVKPYQRYATSEELNFKVKDKMAALKRIEQAHKGMPIKRTDGLNIDAGDYWFNVRVSKTEDYVRLNVEACDKQKLLNATKTLTNLIQ